MLLITWLLVSAGSKAYSELVIESGPGRAGDLTWEEISTRYVPAGAAESGKWWLQVSGLEWAGFGALGQVRLECLDGRVVVGGPVCRNGRIHWLDGPWDLEWQAAFGLDSDQHGVRLSLDGQWLDASMQWSADAGLLSASVVLDGLDLGALPEAFLASQGLRELEGQVSGRVDFEPGQLGGGLRVAGLGFDSEDGNTAGFALDLNVGLALMLDQAPPVLDLELDVSAGELLVGSLYLPPPDETMRIELAGMTFDEGRWRIGRIRLDDPDAVHLEGQLQLSAGESGWNLDQLQFDIVELRFPLAWERWLDGPLSAHGLAGLDAAGRLAGNLKLAPGQFGLDAQIESLTVDDPQGRFFIEEMTADARIDDSGHSLVMEWAAMSLYGLPFGASSLRLAGDDEQLVLVEPLSMPLLDGAVVVERLLWEQGDSDERELQLDARIEPLELAELTSLLGFPVFGGVLSGRFPGVRYVDEVLNFTGGIDIQAFSGEIRLDELAIERPFGTLPAMAAQVEFRRLDLAELTGAFNFGHMEGQLSGHMRDLRLLDWRPVAMDARIFTHDDARRRRISQRAVENLSNLGGAGGALITGTVLRVFDEFPYRRAGLACRLSNNICHIDGIAAHESGGFYIVQGRALPRLDIVGHRRLVDWPQLMAQLAGMMEGED
ncbi:hypothetical protein IC757_04905 [Wenzhouxiangella sp. AB-CW3]|uniref:hypothetical protein n=1 Tax=Wenzhouxiangella sp. AB-CW3 TaxID=2771012 RepID=UPI00168B5382|nr:hypothetical protein [Wenzhouxiangella sp. AB-CW3]QOC23482.1 hypothetical protein IC757_04905 [Wenzhouxiangella sp. AB-CW3]